VSTTSTTTIGDFFKALATRLSSQMSVAANRCFIVDKLHLQDSAVPNFQIEPSSMIVMGDETGLNVFVLEYKVHAVVKVEYDFARRMTEKLVDNKSAFQEAFNAASALNKYEPTGAENQVFLRLENGNHDSQAGLTYATATFRTFLRVLADG
jgi:hypothetical protein